MFNYIPKLQDKNYIIYYNTDNQNNIDFVFFCHETSILKSRKMPESIIIDATYRLNSYKLVFVNIAGTSNLKAKNDPKKTKTNGEGTLQTFEIAGAWISNEKQETYEQVMQILKDIIWREEYETATPLPSVFIIDSETAL